MREGRGRSFIPPQSVSFLLGPTSGSCRLRVPLSWMRFGLCAFVVCATGQTVEFDTKWEPLGQRICLTAALFRTDLDNIASPDPSNPLFVVGGQSQRNQGFEFEGRGALLPELQMNVAYTFLETEVTQSTIPAAVGSQAYNSPKHTVSVFCSYDCSELLTKGLKFGAVVYYRSEVLGVSPQDTY